MENIMSIESLSKIHEIRKSWQTTRTQMFLTCQKINEIEESLSQAKAAKRLLQQKITELEVLEKELIGNIKPIKPTKTVFKTSLEKAITSFVKNAFGHLSKEEKTTMIQNLLKEAIK